MKDIIRIGLIFFTGVIGVPVAVISGVALSTTVVLFPIAYLCGWL